MADSSKDNTRYFKPGREGGVFYVHRRRELKDGSYERLAEFEVGPSGVAVRDEDLLDALDKHPLKGHQAGFYEVKSLAHPKVVANKAADKEEAVIPDGEEEQDTGDVEDVEELSIPETKKYIDAEGLSDTEIIELTEGDERTGIQDIHDAAQKRLAQAAKSADDEAEEVVVKEDITNINQLKDYVQEQDGVDGRELTTPDKILAAAKELDPPHEFPNLDTGG